MKLFIFAYDIKILISMIHLEWYRTFKAVYKNQNYSKAAEELFTTQPTVSNQMKLLEAAIGHKLFIRKSTVQGT